MPHRLAKSPPERTRKSGRTSWYGVYSDLVGAIYDASLEPAHWPRVLESIAESLSGTAAALFCIEGPPARITQFHAAGLPPESKQVYIERFAADDPWRRHLSTLQPGQILTSQDALPDDALRETSFYKEYCVPAGIHHALLGSLFDEPDGSAIFQIFRPAEAEPFTKRERQILGTLFPHLRRAVRIHERFYDATRARHEAELLLNRLRTAVIFLSQHRQVLWMNAEAERLLGTDDRLHVRHGELRARNSDLDRKLRELVRRSCAVARRKEPLNTEVMAIPGNRDMPVVISAIPIVDTAAQALQTGGRACCCLVLRPPEQAVAVPIELLQHLYQLTPAEAKLAAALGSGESLRAYADRTAITYETARTILKHSRQKLNVRSQSELIRLIGSLGDSVLTVEDGPDLA
ncbi:MAG: hypothetical protein QNJ92_04260 [Alphaproteobacteria bacterium]|nr:hypothetical protein [Alphaproteobacteria bacterium]